MVNRALLNSCTSKKMVCFVTVTTAQRATAETGKAKEGRTHRFSTITRADQHSYETNFLSELIFEKIQLSDSVVKRILWILLRWRGIFRSSLRSRWSILRSQGTT